MTSSIGSLVTRTHFKPPPPAHCYHCWSVVKPCSCLVEAHAAGSPLLFPTSRLHLRGTTGNNRRALARAEANKSNFKFFATRAPHRIAWFEGGLLGPSQPCACTCTPSEPRIACYGVCQLYRRWMPNTTSGPLPSPPLTSDHPRTWPMKHDPGVHASIERTSRSTPIVCT
jgi:hypothetical protein